MALGGRLLTKTRNNQMKVGVDVGKGFGEGARPRRNVGGRMVAFRLGRLIENKKIERGMGRLHCGGRHLKGGHNNQIKVGFDVGGDVGEDTRPGRNVWGGVVSRNRASNRRRKKIKNKTRRGLRWLPTSSKDATTNQKYAGATGEG